MMLKASHRGAATTARGRERRWQSSLIVASAWSHALIEADDPFAGLARGHPQVAAVSAHAARGVNATPHYIPDTHAAPAHRHRREWSPQREAKGRSLKIRMPRYLFIHACLCG
jgi:hypothetical protein